MLVLVEEEVPSTGDCEAVARDATGGYWHKNIVALPSAIMYSRFT
jgi:hypothetical protein